MRPPKTAGAGLQTYLTQQERQILPSLAGDEPHYQAATCSKLTSHGEGVIECRCAEREQRKIMRRALLIVEIREFPRRREARVSASRASSFTHSVMPKLHCRTISRRGFRGSTCPLLSRAGPGRTGLESKANRNCGISFHLGSPCSTGSDIAILIGARAPARCGTQPAADRGDNGVSRNPKKGRCPC
jgi:hypothetical protein